MTRYILDTDHVTAFQHGNPRFLQRMKLVDSSRIFVTIITLEEQIKGRFKVINNHNSNPQELPLAYYELHKTFDFFTKMNLLDFDHRALTYYQNLKKQKIRIGSQDLKIGAIALTHQMTLVTRNSQDFIQIPDLTLEDWTK
jgi:tRNA(fMet)-specific endonuclease VapC